MKKRILCFGDSNTWGYNGVDGTRFDDDVRWTGKLQELLGNEYTVIEEGQNGRTTVMDDPFENRLAGLTYLWPCMETHSPFDLIIIMLGSNDTKNHFGLQPESIALGAGRLVDLALKSPFGRDNKAPKVLLVSPPLIKESNAFLYIFNKQAVEKSKGFAKAYEEIAKQYNCYFLDAAKIADPCVEDGLHFNAEGHAKFAEAIKTKVKEILG